MNYIYFNNYPVNTCTQSLFGLLQACSSWIWINMTTMTNYSHIYIYYVYIGIQHKIIIIKTSKRKVAWMHEQSIYLCLLASRYLFNLFSFAWLFVLSFSFYFFFSKTKTLAAVTTTKKTTTLTAAKTSNVFTNSNCHSWAEKKREKEKRIFEL